jgi:cysteine desulfurase/selenocysteine lyase
VVTAAAELPTEIDVARARAETPGCAHVTHLNNAGAALLPQVVLDAMVDHLRLEASSGGYEAAAARADAVQHTYVALARLLGCAAEDVAVVESATRAWDMLAYAFDLRAGDRLLCGRAEYASNYLGLRQLADRTGAVIEVVPDDEHGQLDVAALERMLDDRVRLVSVVHVPTQGGLVNPAAAAGAVCRAAGVPMLLDACQSVGQIPLDVGDLQCDAVTATGRKFLRGPRGTGFLYVRPELRERLVPPFIDLHAATWRADGGFDLRPDARRFEDWESNYAAKIALGVAADYALAWGIGAIRSRVTALAAALRGQLAALDGVTVHDQGLERCAIVTFAVEGQSAEQVAERLLADRINVSVSLGAYSRLDFDARGIDALVRASPHYYTTDDELERLVAHVSTSLS